MKDERRRGQDRRNIDALIVAVLDDQAERRRENRREADRTSPSKARRRSRIPRALVAALAAATAALGASNAQAAYGDAADVARYGCLEDMPCFQWPIMGNYRRGIVTVGGRRLVVGPCRFQRIALAERIDYRRTPHLPGDALATFAGCRMTADRAAGHGERWTG